MHVPRCEPAVRGRGARRAYAYDKNGNHVYHLTARCHDRSFLFKFATWRDEYRRRLRAALAQFDVWLLAECITSNHVHLLVTATRRKAVSDLMQKLQGEFAEWYNIRKRRSGSGASTTSTSGSASVTGWWTAGG